MKNRQGYDKFLIIYSYKEVYETNYDKSQKRSYSWTIFSTSIILIFQGVILWIINQMLAKYHIGNRMLSKYHIGSNETYYGIQVQNALLDKTERIVEKQAFLFIREFNFKNCWNPASIHKICPLK